ncbi:hypothetical protein BH23BAC1_BH23BAC1_39940 [soil metagenome]
MEKHKIILGAFYIVFGAFSIVGGGFVVGALLLSGISVDDGGLTEILKICLLALSIFLILISFPGIIGGIGLLNHKAWARNLVLVIGFLYLFIIPLGTFLSMYTILVLMRDQIALLFTSPASVRINEAYKLHYAEA